MSLRRLLERLSRRVVLRRRLPKDLGGHPIYVSPDASLRFWRRDLRRTDPLLLSLCAELVSLGHSVWDVGANVGLFALGAAARAGSSGAVLAVEPDPFLVGLIRRSASELPAGCAPVTAVQAAVAEVRGVASFTVARRSRAASYLTRVAGSTQAGGARETLQVPTLRLDDLLEQHRPPDVVKVDVEGAELLCLQGSRRLLAAVRPVILCEVTAANSVAVAGLLASCGYTVFDAAAPPAQRLPLAAAPWNTLALPAPRAAAAGP